MSAMCQALIHILETAENKKIHVLMKLMFQLFIIKQWRSKMHSMLGGDTCYAGKLNTDVIKKCVLGKVLNFKYGY